MTKTLAATRAANRQRTAKWRERAKASGIPEARTVDHALLHATMHLIATKKIVISPQDVVLIHETASLILRRHHNKHMSEECIADRLTYHAKGDLISVARYLEETPSMAEIAAAEASRRMME